MERGRGMFSHPLVNITPERLRINAQAPPYSHPGQPIPDRPAGKPYLSDGCVGSKTHTEINPQHKDLDNIKTIYPSREEKERNLAKWSREVDEKVAKAEAEQRKIQEIADSNITKMIGTNKQEQEQIQQETTQFWKESEKRYAAEKEQKEQEHQAMQGTTVKLIGARDRVIGEP